MNVFFKAKSSWSESPGFREGDDSAGRSKHSRDDFRDERHVFLLILVSDACLQSS
jgi:hypothetical protein